jgi:photosystem II stability/assembly factor-like uncharacterized protein
VTNATNQSTDTTYVLKTTNGGDNWIIQYRKIQTGGGFSGYFRVYFLNLNTGYACDIKGIDKTTNGGLNWFYITAPYNIAADMHVLNEDTIWIVFSESLTGGVFCTTNGGLNWTQQLNLGSQNPTKIYFFNGNIGFIAKNTGSSYVRKTTNGGQNWDTIVNGEGFRDMYFVDTLTGWKAYGNMKKTTNGGLNWVTQTLPSGGLISNFSEMKNFVISAKILFGVVEAI